MNAEIKTVIEKLGWRVGENVEGTAHISQFSPAGEDFGFEIDDTDSFEETAHQIYAVYDSFDVDDHINMWVEAKKQNPDRAIPSVRRLCNDAEAICEMLKTLAGAVLCFARDRRNNEYDRWRNGMTLEDAIVTIDEYTPETEAADPERTDAALAWDVVKQVAIKGVPKRVTEIHVDEYYCPACGAENSADQGKVTDKYCPMCGQRLEVEDEY